MAETFGQSATRLSDISLKGASFVAQGTVDTSTAQAISSFSKIGTDLFKGSVLADLEGGEDNKDFVDPSSAEFKDLNADTILQDLNLTTLTAARKQGKISGAGMAALVNSKAKSLINAHPYFAQEIKNSVSEFFAGTRLTAKIFEDEGSLVDKAILSGVKAGRVDPTASRDQQVSQVQAFTRLTTTKNQLSLSKLETDVSEQTQMVQQKNLSKDWFSARTISLEKELKDITDQFADLPVDQRVVRLEQLKIDINTEARDDIDVARLGETNFQANFSSQIASKIDLHKQLATGEITQQVFDTRNATLRAMGENKIMEIPGVPETVAVFSTLRNLPAGLVSGTTQIAISSLMSQMTDLIPALTAARQDPSLSVDTDVVPTGSIPAKSTEEAQLFYSMLSNTFGQKGSIDENNAEELDQEIGVMLTAHADGVARYADTFDQGRWDQLINFFSNPQTLDYIKNNSEKFSPSARDGLDNIIQLVFTNQLLGATEAKMRQEMSKQVAGKSVGQMIELVPTVSGAEVQFGISDKQTFNRMTFAEQGRLMKAVTNLNTNYANRINTVVKATSHLKAHSNYSSTMKAVLQGTGLIGADAKDTTSER